MRKGAICFFTQYHLEHFHIQPSTFVDCKYPLHGSQRGYTDSLKLLLFDTCSSSYTNVIANLPIKFKDTRPQDS